MVGSCECTEEIKSAVFWGITRRRVVIVYRRFGTMYPSHTLSQNVGKQLTHDAAQYPRRPQISSTSRLKHEVKVTEETVAGSS
jgi:hypothetical protein